MQAKCFNRELLILFISIHLIFISVIRAETAIEIDNPRFTEKGLNDKIYEIKAKKGFKTEENLKLIFIEGKFKSSEGTWIYLEADSGNFSQKLNTITLENNVHFYTDNDESFKCEFARFDIKHMRLMCPSPVSPTSYLQKNGIHTFITIIMGNP